MSVSNIESEFQQYTELVKHLKTKPTDSEMLELYGYYKQALYGNNRTQKPSILNIKECSKWNAWNKLSGIGKFSAMQMYTTISKHLIQKYGLDRPAY